MSFITAMVFCVGTATWEEPEKCLWVERESLPFETEQECNDYQMRLLLNPQFAGQIIAGLSTIEEFTGKYTIDSFCVPKDEWETFQIEYKVPSLNSGTDT